jgi:hypothetical protein
MTTIISKNNEGVYYHADVDSKRWIYKLPKGVYKTPFIAMGHDYVPGFEPLNPDNDQPLDIDPLSGNLIKEINDFFAKKDLFKKYGFAHKRGFLLYGPPGTGKSCTIRLLQKSFVEKFDGITLIWDKGTFEDHLNALRKFEPDRSVMVVCEDIDNLVSDFETHVLELLDGQKALNNFVLIATTNNLHNIPSRIKDRPSRIDRLIEIGMPTLEARRKYLEHLKIPQEYVDSIALASDGMSVAKLKEFLIAHMFFNESLESIAERLANADMSERSKDSLLGYNLNKRKRPISLNSEVDELGFPR